MIGLQGSAGSNLACVVDCGLLVNLSVGAPLLASLIAMLLYGFVLVGRAPSLLRTVVKTAAVIALAYACLVWGSPWLLIAALLACAMGDAFLAGDPKRWLAPGLGAFLIGHVLYIVLFTLHRPLGMEPSGLQMAGIGLVSAAAVAMLAFLWKHLGPLRPAVVLYVIVIAVMTGSSVLLTGSYWSAMIGSVAFMASDAVLAISLFRDEKLFGSGRATDWAVWFLYYGAQIGIAAAFVGRG